MFDEHKEIYLFFTVLRPNSIKDTRAFKATENRKLDDGFDEAKELIFSQTLARVQLYKQLGYNTYLKLLRLPL